ncbi:MAG TPA: hypothetical protein RMH99_25385 [Sandaracinaceae bacterium LLY-WYZ-13_1]|nr:hypothetical protein [Sandaracinaceae bacterium LLY-WYZ-13_1]
MGTTSLDDLVSMSGRRLDAVMRGGHPIDEDVLADRRYDGVSLNLPGFVEKLTWVKFAKMFRREADGSLRGWNARIEQTPLDRPWELERRRGAPVTYGHYRVRPCDGYRLPRPYGAGLMLDYGVPANGPLDPTRRVRDPIVAVNEGDSTLLLGWTYVDLGLVRVPTPSFFALRRGVEIDHEA